MNAMTTTHILRTKCGVSCTMHFNEQTARYECEWSRWPLPKKKRLQIVKEYQLWRNAIIEAWSQRTGKKVLVVDL
jgi:hypothetical protein